MCRNSVSILDATTNTWREWDEDVGRSSNDAFKLMSFVVNEQLPIFLFEFDDFLVEDSLSVYIKYLLEKVCCTVQSLSVSKSETWFFMALPVGFLAVGCTVVDALCLVLAIRSVLASSASQSCWLLAPSTSIRRCWAIGVHGVVLYSEKGFWCSGSTESLKVTEGGPAWKMIPSNDGLYDLERFQGLTVANNFPYQWIWSKSCHRGDDVMRGWMPGGACQEIVQKSFIKLNFFWREEFKDWRFKKVFRFT